MQDNKSVESNDQPAGRFSELDHLFNNSMNEIKLGVFDPRVTSFYEHVMSQYPEEVYRQCKLWHLIIGSSDTDKYDVLDLPNSEIEDFIRNTLPSSIA